MVELLGRYSKTPRPLKLRQTARRSGPEPDIPTIHNIQRRLGPDCIAQLVADYQAGMPTTELVATYRVAKGTILRLLRSHGVVLRQQRMTAAEIDQAAQLYATGLSLAAVGRHLEREASVIRYALIRHGVRLRDTHGRER